MKKLLTIIALAISAMTVMAEKFNIGKLTFEIKSPTEVRLSDAADDITTVNLDKTIDYQGKMYTVTSIRHRAFEDCSSLTSVTIPNSVTTIADYAFRGCSSLTSIAIPNSVTSIGGGAFSNCSSLTSITVDKGNKFYDSRNNCNAVIETATNTLIAGCQKTIIPNSVTSIGYYAFADCSSLTSVTIPNSVTSIGKGAFSSCSSLTSIAIPNSVTIIGKEAFAGCSSLTSVTIPNSVTSIGRFAFYLCSSLTSVTIPNSVTTIGDYAFEGCSSLRSPIYNVHCFAFMPTSYSGAYTIPNSIKEIAGGAFKDCSSLTSITIPNSVTSIRWSTFSGCSSLTSVTIPHGVTKIGAEAFAGCSSLISLTIPNSVTWIGNEAFAGCSSLISLTIPNSVTWIGNGAFYGCEALTKLNYNGMQAQWKQIEKIGDWMKGSSIELIHCLDVMIVMTKEDDIVELEENDIFMVVETMPEFPGGQQAMMKFIAENVQYPANAMEKGIQGRVICQFVLEKDGKPSNIQVVRSSGDASLDEEAVRVIGTMPKWKPGIQRGKPVRVTFTLPISFRLSDEPKESTKP